ncbi:MAG TPA: ABC transporter ATP-binding protein [Gemmatimonadales bacterium]|nr:ABC transporter ATP-binding protein [Gemmatimonadales bacterium]
MRPDGPGLTEPAVGVRGLRHRFGAREALAGISFDVAQGELVALLGPNGSGKTTLFRILSTALLPTGGAAEVFGADVARQPGLARRRMGVVFQAPSLDRKLTAAENLRHQGRLYCLGGRDLEERIKAALERVGLAGRAGERVERLSGGLARRVELAKGMLHRPGLLLLDEPTTGLDPSARRGFWSYLDLVRRETGATAVVTTHLLDEAGRGDRIALLDEGRLVALGAPAALTAEIGGDVITVRTADPERLAGAVAARFGCPAAVVEGAVRIEVARGHDLVPRLVEAFPEAILGLTLGKPTLDDVFVHRTGRHLHAGDGGDGA